MQHPGGGGYHAGPSTDLARLKLQDTEVQRDGRLLDLTENTW